jgi:hypothetical protein
MIKEDIRLNDECLDCSEKRSQDKDQEVLDLRQSRKTERNTRKVLTHRDVLKPLMERGHGEQT